jgi:phosphoribosyl-AMP cyclohydrolase
MSQKLVINDGIKVDFAKSPDGLVPAIVTDVENGQVLMLAYMNEQSYQMTLETQETWYWSRSRQALWHKGETSGHYQQVKKITVDCDLDTILIEVVQIGPACHTGARSCFFNEVLEVKEDEK